MLHRSRFSLAMLTLTTLLVSCIAPDPALSTTPLRAVTARDLRIVTGQIIYVPAYSEIFFGTERRTTQLAVTLAIHNTDDDSAIFIQTVRYYDTDGNLVREYVPEPVEVAPLATMGFIVETADTSGGWGANFIVEWGAEEPVYEPVVEAVMIGTQGNGVSIISPGRIVSETRPDALPEELGEE